MTGKLIPGIALVLVALICWPAFTVAQDDDSDAMLSAIEELGTALDACRDQLTTGNQDFDALKEALDNCEKKNEVLNDVVADIEQLISKFEDRDATKQEIIAVLKEIEEKKNENVELLTKSKNELTKALKHERFMKWIYGGAGLLLGLLFGILI